MRDRCRDEVFEEEESAEVLGDSARPCHPDYVRGRRIDNACGASPATLHLFESRMKPRRNAVMQAHVDIVGERIHKRCKIASMNIWDSRAETRHMAELVEQQCERQVFLMSTLLCKI